MVFSVPPPPLPLGNLFWGSKSVRRLSTLGFALFFSPPPPPACHLSLFLSLFSLFSPSSRLFILLVWYHVTTSAVLEQLVVGPPSSAVLFRFSFPAFIPPVVFLFRSSLLGFLGRVATGSEFPFSVRPRGSCLPALTTEAAAIFPLRFLRLAGFHLFAPSSPQFSHILLSFWFLPRTFNVGLLYLRHHVPSSLRPYFLFLLLRYL